MSEAERRYVIGEEIGSGGMATVHLGCMLGDAGFARTVAIKRLHAQYAKDPDLAAMLLDEGRLAARIVHVNVVNTIDVVARTGDLFIVMEYVHGEPLNKLLRAVVRAGGRIPARIAASIVAGALRGLHAAHEARDVHGRLLDVVHRDISPQNIIVATDGVPRVLDFGIAKAAGRAHTETGQIKGKMAYMPIEQLYGDVLDRRADIYSAGVVLWESLVGARLFTGSDQGPNLAKLLDPDIDPPSLRAPEIGTLYDGVTMRALARAKEGRFPTALAMAEAIEACDGVSPAAEIGAWVERIAGEALADRAARITAIERDLAQRIRDSRARLDAREEAITEADDLTPTQPATVAEAPKTAAPPAARETPKAQPIAVPKARAKLPTEASRTVVLVGALVATGAAIMLVARSQPVDVAPSADSASPPPAVSIPVTASVSATASITPPAPTVSAAPPAVSVSASRPARVRAPEVSCTPPYTVDAEGHKHYKRACLR